MFAKCSFPFYLWQMFTIWKVLGNLKFSNKLQCSPIHTHITSLASDQQPSNIKTLYELLDLRRQIQRKFLLLVQHAMAGHFQFWAKILLCSNWLLWNEWVCNSVNANKTPSFSSSNMHLVLGSKKITFETECCMEVFQFSLEFRVYDFREETREGK